MLSFEVGQFIHQL